MPITKVRIGSEEHRLNDNQIRNLRKMVREEGKNASDPDSVLLTRSEFASLKRKGLVVCYRTTLFKGKVPAYMTALGRSVRRRAPPKPSHSSALLALSDECKQFGALRQRHVAHPNPSHRLFWMFAVPCCQAGVIAPAPTVWSAVAG